MLVGVLGGARRAAAGGEVADGLGLGRDRLAVRWAQWHEGGAEDGGPRPGPRPGRRRHQIGQGPRDR
ncbi:MAG TPA: hypothetical protein VMW49_01705, partial [Candidatus Dormibacteraeota bacterium]|nr:hypothetical protein [Candidatus Dormibacteraeota bacterium]